MWENIQYGEHSSDIGDLSAFKMSVILQHNQIQIKHVPDIVFLKKLINLWTDYGTCKKEETCIGHWSCKEVPRRTTQCCKETSAFKAINCKMRTWYTSYNYLLLMCE